MKKEIMIKSLDVVCLIEMIYSTPNTLEYLLKCKPGFIVRVADLEKCVKFIDYSEAIKDKFQTKVV